MIEFLTTVCIGLLVLLLLILTMFMIKVFIDEFGYDEWLRDTLKKLRRDR